MFDPAYDSCEWPDAARLERLTARLPPVLAALLQDERAAGNRVEAIVSGHPAPPVGVCVVLESPASSVQGRSADELLARGLVGWHRAHSRWPTGFTDARGHCFLLAPACPTQPAASPAASPAAVAGAAPAALRAAARKDDPSPWEPTRVGPSAALKAWNLSLPWTHERWHDGQGYDLQALLEMTDAERHSVLQVLLHGIRDWRDVQALAALSALDLPAARTALHHTLQHGSHALRMAVLQHASQVAAEAADSLRTEAVVQALAMADWHTGLSQALAEAMAFHPPAVVDALWQGLHRREAGLAVHFAATLCAMQGAPNGLLDAYRRFELLRFKTEDPSERAAAAADLRRQLAAAGSEPAA